MATGDFPPWNPIPQWNYWQPVSAHSQPHPEMEELKNRLATLEINENEHSKKIKELESSLHALIESICS